ncbi:hypothetical protein [uncultured Chloroflexus sp.]|uniref:hypothetical protein n=1 Tax=uncultured Chloroflexus sp. TaxID=214040 RepID=UPI00261E1EDD|nr:hypothetical protein [uncultured Chloroflexus sp.]
MADRTFNINLSCVSRQRLVTELLIITMVAIVGVLWLFSSIWSQFTSVPAAGYRNQPPLDDPWQNVWIVWWTARVVMSR